MGILLSDKERCEVDRKYAEIKAVISKISSSSEFIPYIICSKCNGTGLDGLCYHDEDVSWQCGAYCEKCRGVGYIDIMEDMLLGKGILNEKEQEE